MILLPLQIANKYAETGRLLVDLISFIRGVLKAMKKRVCKSKRIRPNRK